MVKRNGEQQVSNVNSQLEWLKTAAPNEQPFVSMIVGWQTVRETVLVHR